MAPRAGTKQTTPPAANSGGNQPQGPLTQEDLDDLFLVHLAQARADNDALEKAMEAVRAVRKIRTRNRTLCRTDGFPLSELDSILSDEMLPRHEVEDREAKRLRMRGVAGQPGGSTEQMDLFQDSFAQREKDVAYWRGHGLMTGLRGAENDPAGNGVPQEHVQIWQEEWHAGQERLAKAWATKNRIEGGGKPEPKAEKPAAEPAPTGGEPKPSQPAAENDAEPTEDAAE